MYGISNSQQQGGGGGSAASYKAIKSTLTPSDWQEVAKQPYFVGSNAMEWPIDDAFELHAKRSNDIIGLTSGVDYTMSVTVDGQVYTKTAQMADPSQTGGTKILSLALTDDETLSVEIYDDVSAMMPGVGSFVAIYAPTTVTSFVITSFTGVDFGSSGKATISDSVIKVNSAVTLYVNTSEKIAVGEKTNGSITLTADSIPTVSIPYNLEIVGTDTEGLFELVNAYVPAAGVTDYDGLSNVPIVHQNLAQSGFTPVKNTYYLHTGATSENYTKGVIYKCVETTDTSNPLQLFEVISRYELGTLLEEGVLPYISKRKFISQSSKNVSITGSSEPYLFTVVDNDLKSTLYIRSFVNLYPRDETTEQWLKDHMLSNIIDVDAGKFSFKVNTATLPTTFNLDYVILNVIN